MWREPTPWAAPIAAVADGPASAHRGLAATDHARGRPAGAQVATAGPRRSQQCPRTWIRGRSPAAQRSSGVSGRSPLACGHPVAALHERRAAQARAREERDGGVFGGRPGRNPGRKSRGSNAIGAGSGAFPPRGAPTSRLEAQAVLALLAAFRGERALGLLLVRWLTSSIGASSSRPVRFYFTGPTVPAGASTSAWIGPLKTPGGLASYVSLRAFSQRWRGGRGTAAPRLSSSAVTECSGSQRDVADQSGWRRGRFRWEMCRTHGARAVPSPRSSCCARRSLAGRSRCCART
jgi:hypothetical protein